MIKLKQKVGDNSGPLKKAIAELKNKPNNDEI